MSQEDSPFSFLPARTSTLPSFLCPMFVVNLGSFRLILRVAFTRIVLRTEIFQAKWPHRGNLCDVLAGFRPVEMRRVAGENEHSARGIRFQLTLVELIAESAAIYGCDEVLIGTSRRGAFYRLVKGEFQKRLEEMLPPETTVKVLAPDPAVQHPLVSAGT